MSEKELHTLNVSTFAICKGRWPPSKNGPYQACKQGQFSDTHKAKDKQDPEKWKVLRSGRGAQCTHLKLVAAVQRTRGQFLSWFCESINTGVAYSLSISLTNTSSYQPLTCPIGRTPGTTQAAVTPHWNVSQVSSNSFSLVFSSVPRGTRESLAQTAKLEVYYCPLALVPCASPQQASSASLQAVR